MAPQPRFFIVRPDAKKQASGGGIQSLPGSIVPLIAVDELPGWLDVVGVPRELAVEQTTGLCNLGNVPKSKGSYAVRILQHQPPAAGSSAATAAATSNAPAPPAPSRTSSSSETTAPAVVDADRIKSRWSDEHTTHVRARTSSSNSNSSLSGGGLEDTTTTTTTTTPHHHPHHHPHPPLPPPSSPPLLPAYPPPPPPPPPTEYCRHWCHHGTCKWGLRCRYLHAMPASPAGLAHVGLRDLPGWWKKMMMMRGRGRGGPAGGGAGAAGALAGHQQQYQQLLNYGGEVYDQQLGSGLGFDPRDARVALVRRLGLLGDGGDEGGGGGGGGGGGSSSKKARAQQLRETAALLRELGLEVGRGNGKARGVTREAGAPTAADAGAGAAQACGGNVSREGGGGGGGEAAAGGGRGGGGGQAGASRAVAAAVGGDRTAGSAAAAAAARPEQVQTQVKTGSLRAACAAEGQRTSPVREKGDEGGKKGNEASEAVGEVQKVGKLVDV